MKKSTVMSNISKARKIEELASISKEIFKTHLKIKYEYTFPEIRDIIKRKRISDELKALITDICEEFESMEYVKSKPRRTALGKLKKQLKIIADQAMPKDKPKKMPLFFLVAKKKKKDTKKDIIAAKKKIEKNIKREIRKKEAAVDITTDKEAKAIAKYANTSLKLGVSKKSIQDELKEMGFPADKVKLVIKNL